MAVSVKSIHIKGSLLNNAGITDTESEKALLVEDNYKRLYPTLVELSTSDGVYIDMAYESNPSAAISHRLVLKSKALRFFYDALTANNIIYFLRSPDDASPKLATTAFRTITRVKDRSLQYMRAYSMQNIQQRRTVAFDIHIEPSLLLVPENGKFSKCV